MITVVVVSAGIGNNIIIIILYENTTKTIPHGRYCSDGEFSRFVSAAAECGGGTQKPWPIIRAHGHTIRYIIIIRVVVVYAHSLWRVFVCTRMMMMIILLLFYYYYDVFIYYYYYIDVIGSGIYLHRLWPCAHVCVWISTRGYRTWPAIPSRTLIADRTIHIHKTHTHTHKHTISRYHTAYDIRSDLFCPYAGQVAACTRMRFKIIRRWRVDDALLNLVKLKKKKFIETNCNIMTIRYCGFNLGEQSRTHLIDDKRPQVRSTWICFILNSSTLHA